MRDGFDGITDDLGNAAGDPMADSWTDDELSELALGADPRERLTADATPLDGSAPAGGGPLAGWHGAGVARGVTARPRRIAALSVVGAFLVINALGLCATYGVISI